VDKGEGHLQKTGTKRVLMIADSLGGGGAERQLALLTLSLPEPWQASVFSLGGGIYAERIKASGVDLTMSARRYRADLAPFFALWRTLESTRPDVVHSWGYMACFAADPWCRWRGVPHVAGVIRRGAVYSVRGRFPGLASRLGNLALANSEAGLTAFGVPESRGRVLYNGIADDRLARAPRPRAAAGDFHVTMAATMDDRKDFPALIAAVRQLRAELPYPVRATLLGDGPCRAAWREAAADLEAAGALSFPGRVDEVLDHLADAHAGVLLAVPGWGEGISNSIMEYMAASLPVIATDSGGNPELVVPDETGLLVAAGDGAGVVAALRRLAGDREQAAAMGAAGRRRVEDVFSVSAMVRRAQAIYEEAIALKRR
jgi:glycosyltransferase involved in cell wall biosynthesis